MNIFKQLFRKKEHVNTTLETDKEVLNDCRSPLEEHEQLMIEKVTELLKTKPDDFSVIWFNTTSLEESVKNNKKNILIMIDTGQIIQPMKPIMSDEQKELIKQLICPIVERGSIYLIEQLIKD